MTKDNEFEEIIKKANELAKEEKKDEAEQLLEKELEKNPENSALLTSLGDILFQGKKFGKAEQYLKKATNIDPEYIPAWESLALHYALQQAVGKDKGKFIECYQKIIELDPKNSRAYFRLGVAYKVNNELGKAIEHLKKAIEYNSADGEAWKELGILFQEQGDNNKAREHFKKAVEADPKDFKAWTLLSFSYAMEKQWDKSLESSLEAYKIENEDDLILYNIGTAYSLLGEPEKAIEFLQKATEINPEREETWNNLGNIYKEQGKYQKALEYFKKSIEVNPNQETAWSNMAFVYTSLNNEREANRCRQRAEQTTEKQTLQEMFSQSLQKSVAGGGQEAIDQVLGIIKKSDQSGYHDLTARMSNQLGNHLGQLKHPDAAYFIQMSVDSVRKTNQQKLKMEILESASKFFTGTKNCAPAIPVYFELREFYKEMENEESYYMMNLHLANCMDPLKDDTIEYYNDAKKYYSKNKNYDGLGLVNYKLGLVYAAKKDFKTALSNLEEARENWEKGGQDFIVRNKLDDQIKVARQKIFAVDDQIKVARQKIFRGKVENYLLTVPERPNTLDITPHTKELLKLQSLLMTYTIDWGTRKISQKAQLFVSSTLYVSSTGNEFNINKKLNEVLLEPLTAGNREDRAKIITMMANLEKLDELYLKAFYDFSTAYILLLQGKYEKDAKKLMKNINEMMSKLSYDKNELLMRFYTNSTALTALNPDKAIKLARKGLKIAKSVNNLYFEAVYLVVIANSYAESNIEKAKPEFEQAIRIFEELESKFDLAYIYNEYGLLLKEKGDEAGQEYIEKALKIEEEMEKREIVK